MVEILAAHMEKVAAVRKGAQWLAALSGSVGTRKVIPNSV